MNNRSHNTCKLLLIIVLLVFALPGMAQTIVKGVVKDSKEGAPIPGVTILLKENPSVGTSTDVNGAFSIKVAKGTETLRVSFVGYVTQEVPLKGQTSITVMLEPESIQMSEVVVTALGIKRDKKSLGYSLSEVKGDGLTQTRDANVANALTGKVAGMQIKQAGTGPSGSSRIVIRGNNSIGNNNQPLVVVDGVPIDNSTGGSDDFWGNRNVDRGSGISDISPDDIESISVLKGAAAAALYGSRAGNGVIMITTKKGTESKGFSMSFNSNLTFDTPMQTPTFQNEYGQGLNGTFTNTDAGSWGAKMTGQTVNALMGQKQYLPNGNDLYKDFLRVGTTWTNSVEMTTTKDNSSTRIGITRLDNNGVIPNSNFDRTSFNIRNNSIWGKLTTDFKINYVNQNTDNRIKLAGDPDNIFLNYLQMPRSVAMSDYKAYESTGYGFTKNGAPASYISNYNGMSRNPYWSAYRNTNEDKKDRVIGMASAQYDFAKWFNLKIRYGVDLEHSMFSDRLATGTPYWLTQGFTGDYRVINQSFREQNADFLFTAQGKLFSKLSAVASFGGNVMDRKNTYQLAQASGLVVPNFYAISNGAIRNADYAFTRKQIRSLYGTASLSWDSYAYLDMSLRNDWSSTLPASNRSYIYPSVGGSILVKELLDKFNISTGVVNFAKVRVSWAEVGNDTDPYNLTNYYDIRYDNNILNVSTRNYKVEPNLRPEKIRSWEVGAEVRMLKNRLGIDFAYYQKNAYNQILKIMVPPATGYQYKIVNAGDVENSGVELAINATPVRQSNFEWNTTFTFSKNKNKIKSLIDGTPRQVLSDGSVTFMSVVAEVGGSYGDIYGTSYKRNDKGQIMVDDSGIPLPGDNVKLGNYQPSWMGGWQNTFKIHRFDLGLMVDMRYGGKVYMGSIKQGAINGNLSMTLEGRDGTFVVPNSVVASTGAANTHQITAQNYWNGISSITEPWLYDATNVRLRELSLGYSIPRSFTTKIGLKGVKVSAIARNVFMIYSKTKGFDPESAYTTGNAQGIEWGSMPTLRSIGFNVNVTF